MLRFYEFVFIIWENKVICIMKLMWGLRLWMYSTRTVRVSWFVNILSETFLSVALFSKGRHHLVKAVLRSLHSKWGTRESEAEFHSLTWHQKPDVISGVFQLFSSSLNNRPLCPALTLPFQIPDHTLPTCCTRCSVCEQSVHFWQRRLHLLLHSYTMISS